MGPDLADELLADLDEAQRDAVRCEQVPLAIMAGPGSSSCRAGTR
jgi:hypothetical protein